MAGPKKKIHRNAPWAPAAAQWRRECMARAEAKKIENAKEGDVNLGPAVEDAAAELLAHFRALGIMHGAAQSGMQTTVSQ